LYSIIITNAITTIEMNKRVFLFMVIFIPVISFSQGIINNGAKIFIDEGAFVHGGSMLNLTSGDNPRIDLNGILELEGNWINNSSSENIFDNIENLPDGTLILTGITETVIGGSTKTNFENLSIKNGYRTLQINNCEVNGLLSVNGILNLNSNKLILNNNNFDIDYQSGYILSETIQAEGLGEIEIKIGESLNTFNIPFGTGNGNNDLNITFSAKSAGYPSIGSVVFATYPTNDENFPYPESNYSFKNLTSDKIIDRFWKISPNYTENPDFSLNLSFADVDFGGNTIDTESIKLIRFNTIKESWNDEVFETEIMSNIATTETIQGNSFFDWWTLANISGNHTDFNIPNGITPNNDGYNDTWFISNLPLNTQVTIYNRWGDEVFRSNDYNNDWNGGKQQSGAYYYVIELPDGEILSGDLNIFK